MSQKRTLQKTKIPNLLQFQLFLLSSAIISIGFCFGSFNKDYNRLVVMRKQMHMEGSIRSESELKSIDPVIPIKLVASQLVTQLRTEKFQPLVMPEFHSLSDKILKFHEIYQNLFIHNQDLNTRLAQAIQNRNILAQKYNTIKRTKVTQDTVKRKRRYARDIQRVFYCPIEKCRRGYGSEGSLSHHVRLKHLEFYENGQYEIFIQKTLDQMQRHKKKIEEGAQNELKQEQSEKNNLILFPHSNEEIIFSKKKK